MQLGPANVRGCGGGVGQHAIMAVLSEEGRIDRIVRERAREYLSGNVGKRSGPSRHHHRAGSAESDRGEPDTSWR